MAERGYGVLVLTQIVDIEELLNQLAIGSHLEKPTR